MTVISVIKGEIDELNTVAVLHYTYVSKWMFKEREIWNYFIYVVALCIYLMMNDKHYSD